MPRLLTAVAVTNAKPASDRRLEIADAAAPGLRLVVQPTGAKSFAFRYERPGGKAAKVTLGPAAGPGAISLADARQRVGDMRRAMKGGTDPAEAEKAKRAEVIKASKTAEEAAAAEARRQETRVDVVLDRYLDRHVSNLKSAYEVRRLFDKEVRPVWRARLVGDLTRRDVVALVDAIVDRGAPTTANRTLANVRAWLTWCVDRGFIATSPAIRMRLPTPETVRDRTLGDAELAVFMRATSELSWPWREFFAILALTAQRRDEVAGMKWAELDLNDFAPTWLLPAARTKNGREHSVPLSPRAADVLRHAPRLQGSQFVFSTTSVTSISGFSRAKASLDAGMTKLAADGVAPWHLHDLRRSAASTMARLGVSIAVVEKVLNHVSGTFGGIVGVYQRHDFAAEKREALDRWADHLNRLANEQKA